MQFTNILCALPCLTCLLQFAWSFRRVCYFTNWSRDLQQAGARFTLSDVEPYLCTHLVYAFAAVQTANSSLAPIVTRLMEGREEELQRYRDFNALKTVNRRLKTLLSVGGSIQAKEDFVQIVSSEASRKQFAANVVTYLRTWGFDGLDIDWEYPGTPPSTKPNFTLLLKELRAAFLVDAARRGQEALLLSVAAPVSQAQMKAGYDIPQVSSLVDFINLMAYDFHGSWNSITSFNSPLYARAGDPRFSPELSVNWAVVSWLRQGAAAEKLVLGIAGYGQSFSLRNASQHGVGAPTNGSGAKGRWRRMDGQLAYYEVCEYLSAGGQEVWDDLQRVPFVYLGNEWVGYDNPSSIKDKVDFALEHSLGGVMLWSLDMDDFRGAFCGQGRYPLLSAMVTAIANKMPDVALRMTDTVTWPHPDDVTPSTPSTPETQTAVSLSSPPRDTTSRSSLSSSSSFTTTVTTPTPKRTFTSASVSTRSVVSANARSTTQEVVIITKKQSQAPLHLSSCLLLICAVVVQHCLL